MKITWIIGVARKTKYYMIQLQEDKLRKLRALKYSRMIYVAHVQKAIAWGVLRKIATLLLLCSLPPLSESSPIDLPNTLEPWEPRHPVPRILLYLRLQLRLV